VKLRCHLREARGDRQLQSLVDEIQDSGTGREKTKPPGSPELSRIEQGYMLPRDEWLGAIAQVYGLDLDEMYDWQPPQLIAVEMDPA
jgi:hypothetical protein